MTYMSAEEYIKQFENGNISRVKNADEDLKIYALRRLLEDGRIDEAKKLLDVLTK